MYGIMNEGKLIGVFAAPMSVLSNHPVFQEDSLNLKRHVARRAAQRWEISTAVRPENQDANELFSLLIDKGTVSPIDILVPQNTGSIAKRKTGSPAIASGLKNQSVIRVETSSIIPKGTFIKFVNHNKLYLTLTDKQSTDTRINIYPALRQNVSNTRFNWEDDVIVPFYLEPSVAIGMVYTDGILMDPGVLKFVEAL